MNTNDIILSQIEDRFLSFTDPRRTKGAALHHVIGKYSAEIVAQDIEWLIKQVRMYQDSERNE